ncbi:MAG: hypothetical protein LJE83_01870 [Gammaproteobacteria bacterium]|nr:hypothetical protein [Gammaproteobacteria bacterium]
MDNINEFSEAELCREVSKDGATLKVIATKISEGDWQLAILNEKGISSNWLESFSTAQLAIDAGIEAIEKEGVKEFVDVEGFEYLNV